MATDSKEVEGQLRAPRGTMTVAPLPAAGKPLEHEAEKAPSYFAWTTSPRRASLDSLSRDDELKRATKMHLEQLRASAASLQQSLTSDRLDDLTRQRRLQCKANLEHLDRPSAITTPIVSKPIGPPLAALLSPPPRLSRRAVLPAMPVHPLPMHPLHIASTPKDIQPMKPSTTVATTKETKKVHFEAPMIGRSALQATLEAHLKQRLAWEATQLLQKNRPRSWRKARKATSNATDTIKPTKTTALTTTGSPKEVPSTTNEVSVPAVVVSTNTASTNHENHEALVTTVTPSTTPAAPKTTCGNISKGLASMPKPESVHRVPSHIVPFFPKRHRYTNPLMLHPRYPMAHPRHLYTTEYTAAYCKPKRRALLLK